MLPDSQRSCLHDGKHLGDIDMWASPDVLKSTSVCCSDDQIPSCLSHAVLTASGCDEEHLGKEGHCGLPGILLFSLSHWPPGCEAPHSKAWGAAHTSSPFFLAQICEDIPCGETRPPLLPATAGREDTAVGTCFSETITPEIHPGTWHLPHTQLGTGNGNFKS